MTADQLMSELEHDISALSESSRYMTGKVLGRIVNIMFLRGNKPRLAMDHMSEIFDEYHSRKKKGESVTPEQTEAWIQQLETVFTSFMASNHWRVGNNLIRGLEIILFRKKKPLATEHILALFKDYAHGKYDDSRHHIENFHSNDLCLTDLSLQEFLESNSIQSKTEQNLLKENELLLRQLHQVQEELEEYYLKYHKLKNQLHINKSGTSKKPL